MPDAGYLTIGKVVKRLQAQYPDLSISKVRYLEDEGLLTPSRTPSGYRLYSQSDIHRLETILYLQKNRFMPLQVIKDQLEGKGGDSLSGALSASLTEAQQEGAAAQDRLYPIDRVPELFGASVSLVRQCSDAGLIVLKKSPHGRDLVDGHDIPLIRTCNELQHFGIAPKNLRQYVTAANRESALFEQALMVYARKAGGVEMEHTSETREQFANALQQILILTSQVHDTLLKRQIRRAFSQMGE